MNDTEYQLRVKNLSENIFQNYLKKKKILEDIPTFLGDSKNVF